MAAPQHPGDDGASLGAEAADQKNVRRWIAWGFIAPVIAPFVADTRDSAPRTFLLDAVPTAEIPCCEDAYRKRLRERRTRAAWQGTLGATVAILVIVAATSAVQ